MKFRAYKITCWFKENNGWLKEYTPVIYRKCKTTGKIFVLTKVYVFRPINPRKPDLVLSDKEFDQYPAVFLLKR